MPTKSLGGVHPINAADEGRLEAGGSIVVGKVIVNQGEVVRPSQLIASVRRTCWRERGTTDSRLARHAL